MVPALELIIGPQPRVPELEALEAQNRFNLAFQNFVQVFCKKSHPLVLFLDDMQWADAASLNLITLIVSARATESLLLVLTYRDTEVSADSSVHAGGQGAGEAGRSGALDRARSRSAFREVAEFVADTLHQDAATAMPLAEIIQQKTGGNPFFMRQFLQALYGAQLITFDSQAKRVSLRRRSGQERRDHGERRRAAGDRSCSGCPRDTRATLRVAAVIGGRFELRLLASVRAAVGGRRRTRACGRRSRRA